MIWGEEPFVGIRAKFGDERDKVGTMDAGTIKEVELVRGETAFAARHVCTTPAIVLGPTRCMHETRHKKGFAVVE